MSGFPREAKKAFHPVLPGRKAFNLPSAVPPALDAKRPALSKRKRLPAISPRCTGRSRPRLLAPARYAGGPFGTDARGCSSPPRACRVSSARGSLKGQLEEATLPVIALRALYRGTRTLSRGKTAFAVSLLFLPGQSQAGRPGLAAPRAGFIRRARAARLREARPRFWGGRRSRAWEYEIRSPRYSEPPQAGSPEARAGAGIFS